VRVTQVLCAAGPVDAVTNQGLSCRRLFRSWGWEGADYAAVIAPEMPRGIVAPLRELRPTPDELLLVHYSGYSREVAELFDGSRRTMLMSHNITPARWFWELEPFEAVRCSLAPGQLAEIAQRADVVAGVSEFNAAELRAAAGRDDVAVIPVLFDRERLGSPGRVAVADDSAAVREVLFVGRLAPHKRQDLLIHAIGELRRHEPAARLRLVGVPITPAYHAALAALAERVAPGAVTFENGIAAEELWDRYRGADVFLCVSEHEGFCIPLLEAFHFGLPVLARDAGAIAEVVGDAGIVLDRRDDLATIVELLRVVIADGELRSELRARGEMRLASYKFDETTAKLRGVLTELAA
jgi:glycosyltransferase involved in cell wall biosynthesis